MRRSFEALRDSLAEVPGHKTHFTATGSSPNVAFEDIHRMVVRVDRAFCKWGVLQGGLVLLQVAGEQRRSSLLGLRCRSPPWWSFGGAFG